MTGMPKPDVFHTCPDQSHSGCLAGLPHGHMCDQSGLQRQNLDWFITRNFKIITHKALASIELSYNEGLLLLDILEYS